MINHPEKILKRSQTLKKPHLVIDLDKPYNYDVARTWLIDNHIKVLNIAGPRGSQSPDIYEKTRKFLKTLLKTAALNRIINLK